MFVDVAKKAAVRGPLTAAFSGRSWFYFLQTWVFRNFSLELLVSKPG
jgi:hypothetical protein